jgi:hypothetical protein
MSVSVVFGDVPSPPLSSFLLLLAHARLPHVSGSPAASLFSPLLPLLPVFVLLSRGDAGRTLASPLTPPPVKRGTGRKGTVGSAVISPGLSPFKEAGFSQGNSRPRPSLSNTQLGAVAVIAVSNCFSTPGFVPFDQSLRHSDPRLFLLCRLLGVSSTFSQIIVAAPMVKRNPGENNPSPGRCARMSAISLTPVLPVEER